MDSNIHKDLPKDAVEITQEFYDSLMAGQCEGKTICWDAPLPYLKDPRPPTKGELNEVIIATRVSAYVAEADPLFFMYQRGEVTKQVWLDNIAEIKARFPKVK